MRVIDIYEEVKEATGTCEDSRNFQMIYRATQLLAKKGLFDPLIGYLDFYVEGGYSVALPRDVKSPIKININNTPSFSRSRIFEFTMNTEGSVDGEEVGFSYADRGTSPIQSETPLPGVVNVQATNASDNGKVLTVHGEDAEGRKQVENITISTDPAPGVISFHRIEHVTKDATAGDVYLRVGTNVLARYMPDEVQPEYRVVKLSKTGVAVRMMYRKHVFKITSLLDIIPLHDELGMIWAVKAVKKRLDGHYDEANELEKQAVLSIQEEQASRNEHVPAAADTEIQTAIDTNINTVDGVIVADVYDTASAIFGPVGRPKLFDKITTALEILENKSPWESTIGHVDIWRTENCDTNPDCDQKRGDGLFVLPRFVDVPLAINLCGNPQMARNRWFEFHLNGPGESDTSPCGTWTDLGEVNTIGFLPRDKKTGKVIPHRLAATCEDALDENVEVFVTGWDANGKRIYDGDQDGFFVPCKTGVMLSNPRVPPIAKIDRITKGKARGYIRLLAIREDQTNIAIVGDCGYDDITTDDVEGMIKGHEPSDIILVGDLNYPNGSASTIDENIGAHWRKYIFPFLGNGTLAPLKEGEQDALENHCWPVPGNHDYADSASDETKLIPYLDYFTLPGNERYYSKVFGEVEVFFLNSEFPEPDGRAVGSIQYQWFVAAIAASTATWKVVVFHKNIYSSGDRHTNSVTFNWGFHNFGVHAVIQGHEHNYERLNIDDVTYFVVGTGGPDLNGFEEPPIDGSLVRLETNGALFMYADASELTFSFKDINGNELDGHTLTSNKKCAEPVLLGYYYPDEVEPKYRLIRLPGCGKTRIRVRYKKRNKRVTSIFEPLNLRSRYAIENMLRSIKSNEGGNFKEALQLEALAVEHLSEEQSAKNPIATGGFQFDSSVMPGVTENFT